MGRSISLEDRLIATGGRPAGFDYLRIGLAYAVVVSHTTLTSYGRVFDDHLWLAFPSRPLLRLIVPMFFALSGFLVAGSLERCRTLVMFFGLRAIRIFPALLVEVFLSALLVGPIVSALAPSAYFGDPQFARYLGNVTGDISYYLPGVFGDNPLPAIVNGQLWTVPFELYCYLALGAAALAGVTRDRIILGAVAVATVLAIVNIVVGRQETLLEIHATAIFPPVLVPYFLAGVALHAWRDRVPCSATLTVAAFAASIVALWIVPLGEVAAIVPLTYATIYLGLMNPRRTIVSRLADYSYGVFLYGFVVQQLVMHALPWARTWYWNIGLSIPLATLLAAASWHWVELPASRMRGPLKAIERRWLRSKERLAGLAGRRRDVAM